MPESFKVIVKEMQSLCINIEVVSDGEDDVSADAETLQIEEGLDTSPKVEVGSLEEV